MSVLVGMMVGSKRSTPELVWDSITTTIDNIGDSDCLVIVGVAQGLPPAIGQEVACAAALYKSKMLVIHGYNGSWAQFVNNNIIPASIDFDWTIFAHDDIELLSNNLIRRVEGYLEGKRDPVGWISFLDMDYLTPTSWAPSIREGFHIDAMRDAAWSRRKTHQFHTLPECWWDQRNTLAYMKSLPYDFPRAPVRCHGPFSHFIMMKSDVLRRVIGKCEEWSPVSLLVDEDWGLTALKNGLYNIWMPQLKYIHKRPTTGTRANFLIDQYGRQVQKMFTQKWRFPHKAIYTKEELANIQARYRRTLVHWSMPRCTYEWDYVK